MEVGGSACCTFKDKSLIWNVMVWLEFILAAAGCRWLLDVDQTLCVLLRLKENVLIQRVGIEH